MIRDSDRRIAAMLVRLRIWKIVQPRDDLFRCPRLRSRKGTHWLWNLMRKRQAPDPLWHAPCCPANRWSGVELVIQRCTCDSARCAKQVQP